MLGTTRAALGWGRHPSGLGCRELEVWAPGEKEGRAGSDVPGSWSEADPCCWWCGAAGGGGQHPSPLGPLVCCTAGQRSTPMGLALPPSLL